MIATEQAQLKTIMTNAPSLLMTTGSWNGLMHSEQKARPEPMMLL